MYLKFMSVGLSIVVLAAGLVSTSRESAVAQQAQAEGEVTVLARGPVHEAFANPLTVQARPAPVISKAVPALIEELLPDQKPEGNNVQWVPGYWAWDDDSENYLWVSGLWRDLPPGRVWVPGYWVQVDAGSRYVAGYWTESGRTEVQYLPPPPESIDTGPSAEAPGADYAYVPGCWVYYETRYAWRPGFWQRYYAGWCWVPARHCWTPGGYVFTDGYWDYPMHRRGLLFAPVFVDQRYWGQPGWYYRPRYVVLEAGLVGAMFVRADLGRYYFGNYFGDRYAGRGFMPWVDYRVGRGSPDPLFAQYRFQYQQPDRWEKSVRASYAERQTNEAVRPSIQVTQNTVVNTQVDFRTRNVVTTLAQASQATTVKLHKVTEKAHAEEVKAAKQAKTFREQRQKVEAEVSAKGPATQPADGPRTAKLDLPQQPAAVKADVKTPPAPKLPKQEDRPIPKAKDEPKDSPKGKDEPKTKDVPKSKDEPKDAPKAKDEPKTKDVPKSKDEPKDAPKAKDEPKTKDVPKGKDEPQPVPKKDEPKPQPEPQPAPKSKDEPKPKPEPQPAPKAEPKPPPPKPDPQPAPKAEPKPIPKPPSPPANPAPPPPPPPKAEPKPPPPPANPPAKSKDKDKD